MVFVCLNEIQCLIRKPVREVLALRTIRKLGIIIGNEIAFLRVARNVAANIDVETLADRSELRIVAEMPFADAGTDLTSRLDRFGNGDDI